MRKFFGQNLALLWHGIFKIFDRHALHAKKITFIHPDKDDELSIDAPISKDILKLQKQLKIINE